MSAPEIDLYPTPTRKKLCRDIENGKVRWYWWASPWASNLADGGRKVTADVQLLQHHELVEILPLADPRDTYSLVRMTDTGRLWAGLVQPVYYEYRVEVDGECREFDRLRDVEAAAEALHNGGVDVRIEYRQVEPGVTDWVPLAWDDTLAGRLGYEPFPGCRELDHAAEGGEPKATSNASDLGGDAA